MESNGCYILPKILVSPLASFCVFSVGPMKLVEYTGNILRLSGSSETASGVVNMIFIVRLSLLQYVICGFHFLVGPAHCQCAEGLSHVHLHC